MSSAGVARRYVRRVVDLAFLGPEQSRTQRQAANEWYDHTLYSRLNDKLRGAIVLIMHRLHESLPSGVLDRAASLGTDRDALTGP